MMANLHRQQLSPPGTEIDFVGGLTLAAGRAHEFCGPSRRILALMLAGQLAGPVIWITSGWRKTRLNAEGALAYMNPGRLLLVSPSRGQDVLWSMEEALRSGAVALVVADLSEIPALVPVRRLHLAAEAGAVDGMAPTGIILTQGAGGAQGIESRWHLSPYHAGDVIRWHLECRHARSTPPRAWILTRNKGRLTCSGAGHISQQGSPAKVLQFPTGEPARQRLVGISDPVN
ncbi:MAG: hypothetical protein OXF74_06185 [Rhodobacteraceae bacterium]|nr:hypothetical protein [Paracoccaceae bacterium]